MGIIIKFFIQKFLIKSIIRCNSFDCLDRVNIIQMKIAA